MTTDHWWSSNRESKQEACIDDNAEFCLPPAKVRYRKAYKRLTTALSDLQCKVKRMQPCEREQTITSLNNIVGLLDDAIDIAKAVVNK
jgi:hypothetical protein